MKRSSELKLREVKELGGSGDRGMTMKSPSAKHDRVQIKPRKEVNSFLSTVYRGLRTSLKSISEYLGFVLEGEAPNAEHSNRSLTLSFLEAHHLTNRLRDLLITSSIKNGNFKLHFSPFSIKKVMETCVQQLKPIAQIKAVRLQSTAANLPDIEGDEALIIIALQDILDTLIRFASNDAQVTVSAELRDNQVLVQSTDSSGGTTKEIIAKLSSRSFDPSDPSEGSTAGHAMAIAIASHIIKAHGGRIMIEEDPQIGSSYSFALPMIASREKVKRARPTIPRILIVEDEPAALEMMEYALEHEGFKTFTTTNGIEALEIVGEHRVDLIILDVMLPGMDGFEVCHRLKSNPDTVDIPVLMVSAKAREEDIATALRVGAQIYLEKPFVMPDLVSEIRTLLAETEAQQRRELDGT